MHCPACGTMLVEIAITLRGSRVRMRSCSTCDTRWWDADGSGVDLPEVLDLATDLR